LPNALFALVVAWCTSPTECWTAPVAAGDGFASLEACRAALPSRAHDLLLPHFREHHLDVSLTCQRTTVATASAGETPGGAPPPSR
jgi:hypothetical protein